MTEQKPIIEDKTRTIVLLYAMFENGSPCWIFVAVKPSKYQPFINAQKEGKIDLYAFENYGEIIVSGEGKSPPDEIILKVAEMYQTDPSTLFKSIKDEEAQSGSTPKSGSI